MTSHVWVSASICARPFPDEAARVCYTCTARVLFRKITVRASSVVSIHVLLCNSVRPICVILPTIASYTESVHSSFASDMKVYTLSPPHTSNLTCIFIGSKKNFSLQRFYREIFTFRFTLTIERTFKCGASLMNRNGLVNGKSFNYVTPAVESCYTSR